MKNNIQHVYLLWHTHELDNGEEDTKLLGVYSSEQIAKSKIGNYIKLPGFKEYREGFEISKYQIDEDNWIEGFITV